ncbi:MAG: hypothetical protein SNJ54_17075 [Anaerolineae bacterium]
MPSDLSRQRRQHNGALLQCLHSLIEPHHARIAVVAQQVQMLILARHERHPLRALRLAVKPALK